MNYKRNITVLFFIINFPLAFCPEPELKQDIPLDSIRLSDPCILTDKNTMTYYMTATGGLLWRWAMVIRHTNWQIGNVVDELGL